MDEAPRPPLVVIGGATATGKTGLAIRLAERLAGRGVTAEIISADSRQVYRGLDIGTAKATPAERARVPHHGLDLVDPDEPFTVADFVREADRVLARLAVEGRLALLVGGTGLYLRAVGQGLDVDALPHDPVLRTAIEVDLQRDGLPALVERLRAIAPGRADVIDQKNPRRVVRSLEIATLLGDAPMPEPRGYPGPIAWLGLRVEPAVHRAWIATRARAQFAAGLLDEAASLRTRYDPTLPAFSAIGYREAWAVLDGKLGLEGAISLDTQRNLAFAKRQATWFRKETALTWLDVTEGAMDEAAIRIVDDLLASDGRRSA